jgi:hypothetical protein
VSLPRLVHLWAVLCSLAVIACLPVSAEAQNPQDSIPVIRIPFPRDTVPLRLPSILSLGARDSYRRAVQQIEAARATAFQQNMRSIVQAVWGQVAASSFATEESPPSFAETPAPKPDRTVAAKAGDIIAEHSDLTLQLNARMELRAEKNLNERCAVSGFAQPVFACQSSFLPITDFQFNARSGGVVAQRIHVDVDYDTQREFDG